MDNPSLYLRRGGEFLADNHDTFYWNNQLLIYDDSAPIRWSVATALLYGGFSTDGQVLSDSWRIEILTSRSERVVKGRWIRVNCLKEPAARLWHTAAFVDGLLFVYSDAVTEGLMRWRPICAVLMPTCGKIKLSYLCELIGKGDNISYRYE
uniref:Uncharacterized protein n=1 Tax=Parascaris equorum TaxID=6256 RepID=A0A914R698_PAREQ